MKRAIIFLLLFTPLLSNAQDNWIMVNSGLTHPKTIDALQTAMKQKGFKVFDVIEHAKEAESAGLTLRPTTVIIFGNPKAGTLVMQCDQRMGRVLPLKILVWEEEAGQVRAGFVDPEKYLKEYTLEKCKDVIMKMKAVQVELLKGVEKK